MLGAPREGSKRHSVSVRAACGGPVRPYLAARISLSAGVATQASAYSAVLAQERVRVATKARSPARQVEQNLDAALG